MPRYKVTTTFTQTREVKVYARDETDAQERAVTIVEEWRDVSNVEAGDVEQIDE
jgi:hypothetical protein